MSQHIDPTPKQTDLNSLSSNITGYGTNENGSYWKFADGTLICSKIISLINVSFTTAFGSLYQNATSWDGGTWPVEFLTTPFLSANLVNSGGSCFLGNFANTSRTNVGSCAILRPTTATLNVAIDIIAIGRWK